jgi:hypothetical protein
MTVEEEKQEEVVQLDVEAEAAATEVVTTEAESSELEKEVEESDGKAKHRMTVAADAPWKDRMWEVFTTFWPLGLVSRCHSLFVVISKEDRRAILSF